MAANQTIPRSSTSNTVPTLFDYRGKWLEYSGISVGKGSDTNMSTSRVSQDDSPDRKPTKQETARKLARLVEADMQQKGLPEAERSERVNQFVDYVDAVKSRRAKQQ